MPQSSGVTAQIVEQKDDRKMDKTARAATKNKGSNKGNPGRKASGRDNAARTPGARNSPSMSPVDSKQGPKSAIDSLQEPANNPFGAQQVYPNEALRALGVFSTALSPSTNMGPLPTVEKEGVSIADMTAESLLKTPSADLNDTVDRIIKESPPAARTAAPEAPVSTALPTVVVGPGPGGPPKVPPQPVVPAPAPGQGELQNFLQGNSITFNVVKQAQQPAAPAPPVPAPTAPNNVMLGAPVMGAQPQLQANLLQPVGAANAATLGMMQQMLAAGLTPSMPMGLGVMPGGLPVPPPMPPWMAAMATAAAASGTPLMPPMPPSMLVPPLSTPLPMPMNMPGLSVPAAAPVVLPQPAAPAAGGAFPKPAAPRSKYEPLLKRPQSSLEEEEEAGGTVECVPVWPGDCRGIIYQIATNFGVHPWACPVLAGKVAVTSTPLTRGWASDVVAPQFEGQVCYTENEQNAWVAVDLKYYRACVTHYALAHRHSGPGRPPREPYTGYFIRNWQLQGSNDGVEWTVLSAHGGDSMINKFRPYSIANVKIEQKKFYRHFRIQVVDEGNSQGTHALIISCLELYGKVEAIPAQEAHLYSAPPPPRARAPRSKRAQKGGADKSKASPGATEGAAAKRAAPAAETSADADTDADAKELPGSNGDGEGAAAEAAAADAAGDAAAGVAEGTAG
eukprot:CAMPEP_0174313016 /NCGR_PEP_ID=MMETSP0810-20121108/4692_1 /TAXON_ID=73025 ORGANISM="Eutreptiella gymnastica-like, Strain CCMP1594" /NCGR_SAMPLE_ID=MMETSP0810 /ASSEMBLY_ACC=CAM_ASM_000659 /LENGTH=676 /DNA_ID=CAMNT_0015421635 /DNA_START=88 /DNA_END=2115 /DNA_ORIENTATION=-